MKDRFRQHDIEREIKKVQLDIRALIDEKGLQNEEDQEDERSTLNLDASGELVQELLRSSADELRDATKIVSDLPLPVPPELETEERIDEILQVSEEALGGLKLSAVRKTDQANTWELSGTAGVVEFKISFQTINEGGRTVVCNFKLQKIPPDAIQELEPLIELASRRNCVRTWLLGLSEYAFLVQEREQAFAEIRASAPFGSCRQVERSRLQNFIEAVSDDGRKWIRLYWKAEITLMPSPMEPNEFISPKIELSAVRGFSEKGAAMIQDLDAFAPLVRQYGVAKAMLRVIRRMYKEYSDD